MECAALLERFSPIVSHILEDIAYTKLGRKAVACIFDNPRPEILSEVDDELGGIMAACEFGELFNVDFVEKASGIYECVQPRKKSEWVFWMLDLHELRMFIAIGKEKKLRNELNRIRKFLYSDRLPINNGTMRHFGKRYGNIKSFSHAFHCEGLMGNSEEVTGQVVGGFANDEYRYRMDKTSDRFYISSLTCTQSQQGLTNVTLKDDGYLHLSNIGTNTLMTALGELLRVYSKKYESLLGNYLPSIAEKRGMLIYSGQFLEFKFDSLRMDTGSIVSKICRHEKRLGMKVIFRKSVSPEYGLMLLDRKNVARVQLSVTPSAIKLFVHDRAAVNLAFRLENFIQMNFLASLTFL